MRYKSLKFYFCLSIIAVIIFFWLISSLFYEKAFKGVYQQTNPDSLLFARELEQSILKGRILDIDNYAAFPYKTKTGFAPFYMYFLFNFVNFVFYLFPNLDIDPVYVAGILPIIIPWLTSIFLIFSIYKLTNNKILTLFVAFGMLPGFSIVMTSGFLNLDYDYLINFFIWFWIICGAFYIKNENHIFVYIGSITTALFISTWTGSPFFYFFVTAYAFVIWIFNPKTNSRYLTYSSLSMFIGSIVALIFVPRNDDTYRYVIECNVGRYSYIQGLLVFIGSLFIYFLYVIRNCKKPRIIGFSILSLVCLLIILFFHESLLQATGILFQKDPVHATIGELTPGINYKDVFSGGLKDYLFRFGPFLLVFPFFLLNINSLIDSKEIKYITYWIFIFLVLSAFYQARYLRWMGCGYGFLIGFSCFFLWKVSLIISNHNKPICTIFSILPIMLIGIIVNYSRIFYDPSLIKEEVELYSWIKENTPPTSGYYDDKEPEYGILAYWDKGNKISYYTKRPVVTSNSMWGYKTMANIFSCENEQNTFDLLVKNKISYIVLDPSRLENNEILSYWSLFKNMPETSEYKLYYGDVPQKDRFDYFYFWIKDHIGLTPLGDFGTTEHFRIVFANENNGRNVSKYFVFQSVEGADLNFKIIPGAKITLSLNFKVGDMNFIYKTNKISDENGHCRFILPYSTGYNNGNILTDPFYKVAIEKDDNKSLAKLVISDEDVVKGQIVNLEKQLEIIEK